METEEEDYSKLSLPLENDSTMTSKSPTPAAQTPTELAFADPQCVPQTDPEMNEPQPVAGDVESQFIPPESETKLPDTLNYQDAVAAENTSPLDAGEFEVGGGGGESHSPSSQTPQSAVAESVNAEAETAPIEGETPEILQEVRGKGENDGDFIPGEGGPEASGSSDSPDNKENDGDVNAEVEVPEVNKGTETKTNVVADVAEKATCMTEELATADEMEKSMEKPEAAHVAEEPKIADMAENLAELKDNNEVEAEVKENNECEAELNENNDEETVVKAENGEETEVEEEKESREESVLAEGMEVTEQTKIGDIMEETKTSDEVADDTHERDGTEEVAETMEEQDKEELDSANAGEEVGMEEGADEVGEAENAEDMELADVNEVTEEESSRSAGGKRKRGKNTKASARISSRKKAEEDVCFICFDGGDLVLCDRRGCPKAYHPTCVNRDDAFFRARGRWNCGWHLCSICEKNAHYMCYTCTFSLCKGCVKDAVILCVRGNKGLCESCMKTVMLIERNQEDNKEMANVDFDDKSSWEYLFKDYWIDLKGRLSLTSDELSQAKNPWKGSELPAGKLESRDELYDAHNDEGSGSDNSSGNLEVTPSKRRKAKKRLQFHPKERDSMITKNDAEGTLADESTEWASKELLEFIMHMMNGDASVYSQFDVQALLLEYIKRNKLRDPRRKSQIICDARLQKLFGKPRVGHFEMLKLLESHFLLKEDSHVDDLQHSVVDTETNQSEADGNSDGFVKGSKDRRRKSRKKSDGRGLQSNVDDYAAIDTNNINLIYLRRSLVENLIPDTEIFHDKVVGSFVRIRISGSAQKQDLYRLVQVVGTNKAAEPYKVGKRTTDFLLEILNLNKTETVSIDIISNQDFTEDELKRLRQSIKCGLINRLTVGDIQEKAMALQAIRVEDALETEITRLSHLRDRASDLGRRKQLRECVEKLQLLKSPDEHQRRLEEIPEVHADTTMDPSYDSEEDDGKMDDRRQESYQRPGGSSVNRRGREPISPGRGSFSSNDSWSGRSYSSMNRELGRSLSNKGFSNKVDDGPGAGEISNENLLSQGRDKETQQSQTWERAKAASNMEISSVPSESIPTVKQETAMGPSAMQSATTINETEKIWHYKDPSGKIQGPFSMVQLRKWSNTGYFPADLRIWRTTEKQDDSILLTEALAGKFERESQLADNSFLKNQLVQNQNLSSSYATNAGESWKSQHEISDLTAQAAPALLDISKYSADKWDSERNLPSPTPAQAARSGTKRQPYESKWSPTPVQSAGPLLGNNSLAVMGGNGELRHPAIGVSEHFATPLSSSLQLAGSTNSPLMHFQSTLSGESPRVQVTSHLPQPPDSSGASLNVAADGKSLQNLVHPVAANNPLVGTQGWGSVSVSKPEMGASHAHPGAYSNWGDAPPASPFIAGNPTGVSSAPPTSDVWRGVVTGQSNIQPSVPSNAPWGMTATDNQTAPSRQGPENKTSGWGPITGNPNVGWGGSVAANSNQGWSASVQGPAPGNANPGWIRQGNANPGWGALVQGQSPGNAFPGWVPSGQGPPPVNVNQAWVPPGHGLSHGNGHSSWTTPPGNNGDRFSGQRDSGTHSQGSDSGYGGGGRPWNRQSSFIRGDSLRPPFKGQRVCKYHESGHCKKGAACDYLHT